MPYHERPTFHLYRRPHNLQLGHLLLGNYKTPTHVPHSPVAPLSDTELIEWTTTTKQSGTFTNARGWNITAEVEAFGMGKLGGGQDFNSSTVIVATSGKRLELHSHRIREFFQEKVLPTKGVKENLKRWLTISRTDYVLTRLRLTPPPEIWCLTGLFELSDVTAVTVTKHNPRVSFGVSSELVTALSGGTVPLGGSVEIGGNFTVTCDAKYPNKAVWAAQYQLINSESALRMERDENPPINYIELYPDYTYNRGRVLGDGDEKDEAFTLEVSAAQDQEVDVDMYDENYWDAYREAEATTVKLNNLSEVDNVQGTTEGN